MARCGCAGSSCGCVVIAGRNIRTGGTGAIANPYSVAFTVPQYELEYSGGTINLSQLGGRTSVNIILLSGAPQAGDWIFPSDVFDMTLGMLNRTGATVSYAFPADVVGNVTGGVGNNTESMWRISSIPGGGAYVSSMRSRVVIS